MKQYDIIFAGAGLSALSMAAAMARQPAFAHKKILLIDRDRKESNDRTWCFWATDQELRALPPVIFRSWDHIHFYSPVHSALLNAGDYRYHMVRGVDFYHWAKQTLSGHSSFEWVFGNIEAINADAGAVQVNGDTYSAEWVLNSALPPVQMIPTLQKDQFRTPFTQPAATTKGYLHLLQHFRGWIVRTPETAFDPNAVTFMDFRVPQQGDTRFVYVLPLSDRTALVEYTVFSPALLEAGDYDAGLRQYIKEFLKISDYEIEEAEFGVIPMTDFPLSPVREGQMLRIGTGGGFVKASSGYAFKRTQRKVQAFVADWAQKGAPNPALLSSKRQYRIYDSVFLRALHDGLVPADLVFGSFFKNLGGTAVFRFLDEDTNFLEDFRALNAVPTLPFAKAAFLQMNRLPYV